MGNLLLLSASAGSGKTYRLAKEYLKLALKTPNSFRHILAVTFTNKATAEMKDRILSFLLSFSNGHKDALFIEVRDALGIDDSELGKRSKTCLHAILHDYHFFSVQTLDSFFQKIVRAFARENALPASYQIQLDTDRIKEQLLDELMQDVGKEEKLTEWLMKYSREILQEGSWDIRKSIQSLIDEIFKEDFLTISNELPNIVQDTDLLNSYIKQINIIKSGHENFLQAEVHKIRLILAKYQLEEHDFYRKNLLNILNNIEQKKYEVTNTLRAVLAGNNKWEAGQVKGDHLDRLHRAVEEGIKAGLQKIVDKIDQDTMDYQTAMVIRDQIYTLAILAFIKQKSRLIQRENEWITNQDIAEFLFEITSENDSPFIYEKVGSKYNHFLLDEFQDTSRLQWSNIRPLLENSLAEGNHFSLIVGDVKQSIYRWRSGDLELLLEQVERDLSTAFIDKEILENNYRSKKNIIDFNNYFFQLGVSKLSDEIRNTIEDSMLDQTQKTKTKELIDKIELAYSSVSQNQAIESKSNGLVKIHYLENDDDTDSDQVLMEHIAQTLGQLQSQNVANSDIGILVRTNGEGAKFIKAYHEYGLDKQYAKIVSQDSLFVKNSLAVKVLLSAFEYLFDRTNQVALLELLRNFLLLNEKPISLLTASTKEEFLKQLPDSFSASLAQLENADLLTLCERLIAIFQLNAHQHEFAFLSAFQSWFVEFVSKEKADLASVIAWWAEERNNPSIDAPAGGNDIQLMTIHKSKGLQFKVVILPYFSWKLDETSVNSPYKKNNIWSKMEQTPYNQIKWHIVPYSENKLANSYFSKAYYDERVRINLDNLNMLYVAWTRPEDSLICFSQRKRNKDLPEPGFKSVDQFFYRILLDSTAYKTNWDESSTSFQLGDWDQISASNDMSVEHQLLRINHYPVLFPNEKVKVRAGHLISDQSIQDKINFGILVHDLLAKTSYRHELDASIKQMQLLGEMNGQSAKEVYKLINNVFELAPMTEWFSTDAIIKTEASILLPNGKEKRIDRLVIKDGKCTIVDYKTGQQEHKHHAQLREYADLLSKMGFEQIEAYLLYIDHLQIEQVV